MENTGNDWTQKRVEQIVEAIKESGSLSFREYFAMDSEYFADKVSKYLHLEKDELIEEGMKRRLGAILFESRFPIIYMAAWAKADDEDRELEAIDIINKSREDNESVRQEYKELFYEDEILQAAFLMATSRLGKPLQMIFVTDKSIFFYKKGLVSEDIINFAKFEKNEYLVETLQKPKSGEDLKHWRFEFTTDDKVQQIGAFREAPDFIWLTTHRVIAVSGGIDEPYICGKILLDERERIIDCFALKGLFLMTNHCLMHFKTKRPTLNNPTMECNLFRLKESPNVELGPPAKKKWYSSSQTLELAIESKSSQLRFKVNKTELPNANRVVDFLKKMRQ